MEWTFLIPESVQSFAFDGYDEGFLHRAGKTVSAAVYLENAAVDYAKRT
jgi:hypothetical protein